jgi:hypothetical protein
LPADDFHRLYCYMWQVIVRKIEVYVFVLETRAQTFKVWVAT